jgi:hypothetical protein
MKLSWLVTIVILISVSTFAPARAQTDPSWVVQSSRTVRITSQFLFGISDNGQFIVDRFTGIIVWDTISEQEVFRRFTDPFLSIAWSDNTLVYGEYPTRNAGPPTCDPTAATTMTFGIYDVTINRNQIHCIVPLEAYINANGTEQTISQTPRAFSTDLRRSPFNPDTVLLNYGFLLNLTTREWVNLLPERLNVVTTGSVSNAIGYADLWWDPTTQHPLARANASAVLTPNPPNQSGFHRTGMRLQVCPLDLDLYAECTDIVTRPELDIFSWVVTPDGDHILWTSRTFTNNAETDFSNIPGDVTNLRAFVSNIETGVTQQIFQLYPQDLTTPVRGLVSRWSPRGQALAISVIRDFNFSTDSQNEVVIVTFQS